MSQGERLSRTVNEFHGHPTPEPLQTAGYSAVIDHFSLRVPLPRRLSGIAARHHKFEDAHWLVLTPRHAPTDGLAGHLRYALKWEGLELGVLASLFRMVPENLISAIVREEPTGGYARRLWFLYEWLTGRQLDLAEPGKVRAVPVVDLDQQYGLSNGTLSSRHKVLDNLPGTSLFCPMVRRTEKIEAFIAKRLDRRAREIVGRTHADIMRRAAAFLLLDDSRASFQIEGEKPSPQRAERWGQAIAEAGLRQLSVAEFERLQKVVIGDTRFVHLGLRTEGGFVGTHDRRTQEPIPSHISARAEDLPGLVEGIVAYDERAKNASVDAVVTAAALAFGFVYVHPFEDGNGRLHRWLIHHSLATANYNPPGVVFPVSAAIQRQLDRYKAVLESYSRPLLAFIEWEPAERGNVRVLNDTRDYYRFFDATEHAEFLYQCVEETIDRDLPDELAYLESYDKFSVGLHKIVDMPDRTAELLFGFLRQGHGHLSKRAREGEFAALADHEVDLVEKLYTDSFASLPTGHDKLES